MDCDSYPLPDAPTRKRGVDARKDMKSKPVVAVVTANPLSKRGATLRLLDRMHEETTAEMAAGKSPRRG